MDWWIDIFRCALLCPNENGCLYRLNLASGKPEGTEIHDSLQAVDSSVPVPYCAPSTDLTELEQSLDYWHRQNFRQHYGCMTHGEDESQNKVRYNDTGSLEEVRIIIS
jgi:hypothetical protein